MSTRDTYKKVPSRLAIPIVVTGSVAGARVGAGVAAAAGLPIVVTGAVTGAVAGALVGVGVAAARGGVDAACGGAVAAPAAIGAAGGLHS